MTEKMNRPSYDELPFLEGTPLRTAWGQYGETDELGAVNLLTAERVRAAAQSVVTGERFSLGLPLHLPDPPIYGRKPFQHKVYATMPNITDDRLDSFFPQGSSQWDALAHFAHPTKGFYNGFTMADVLDRGKVGIHNPAVKGIVGRGLLADVARLRAPFDGQDQIGSYLSAEHRGDPADGCTLGALAADAARKRPTVQARFAEAVDGMASALADHLARKPSRGKRARARRERALQMLSELVGALVLARAVAAAHPVLSDEILAANRRGLR